MNTTCLLEPPTTMLQANTICFEVSQGPPGTAEENVHHIDICYFLSSNNGDPRRHPFRTIEELVGGYIAKSRRIVHCELCPHPVRNKPHEDTRDGSTPLSDGDMIEFKRVLSLADGQRFHLSFPS